jgi:hypothetical protein
MSTCNRLDLQTLGSQPIMPKNLPDHWSSSYQSRSELAGLVSTFLGPEAENNWFTTLEIFPAVGGLGIQFSRAVCLGTCALTLDEGSPSRETRGLECQWLGLVKGMVAATRSRLWSCRKNLSRTFVGISRHPLIRCSVDKQKRTRGGKES